MAGDLPDGLAELAMAQGIAFFASPDDLALPTLGHDGVLAVLRTLPKDETVVLLAHLSTMLHAYGETARSFQTGAVQTWFRGESRDLAVAWLERYPNGIILTYEAVVRLSVLAMHYGEDRSREFTDDDVFALVALLPEVQAWLARLDKLHDPDRVPHSTEDREDTAFTLFLSVNAPGMGEAAQRQLHLPLTTTTPPHFGL
ncbi:MAG: hypothetical protein ABMB14_39155 [Myxococcota bacterium]